jgi:hypothetical protein
VSGPAGARIVPAGREQEAALHILAAPSIRERAIRFVSDTGEVDWLRLEQAAGLWSWDQWLLVAAAQDLFSGRAPAGLKRLCNTLDTGDLRRVLEAVCILRPDAAPTAERSR